MSNGKSVQQYTASERRRRVVELRLEGYSWNTITNLTGYSNRANCIRAFHQACRENPADNNKLAEVRNEQDALIDLAIEECLRIVRKGEVPQVTAAGKVATDPVTNEVVTTNSEVLRAMDTLLKVMARQAKLHGADDDGTPKTMSEAEARAQMAAALSQAETDAQGISGWVEVRNSLGEVVGLVPPKTRPAIAEQLADDDEPSDYQPPARSWRPRTAPDG